VVFPRHQNASAFQTAVSGRLRMQCPCPGANLVRRARAMAGGAAMGVEGMRQRARDMAEKLRQKGQGEQSSQARHRSQGRSKLEEQMKKIQERRHRHR
jgi:hypothetical protein